MANNVESCCLKFDWFQTLHYNCQVTRNNMQQGVQTDATCNIPTMLHLFAQGFMAEPKYGRKECTVHPGMCWLDQYKDVLTQTHT